MASGTFDKEDVFLSLAFLAASLVSVGIASIELYGWQMSEVAVSLNAGGLMDLTWATDTTIVESGDMPYNWKQ